MSYASDLFKIISNVSARKEFHISLAKIASKAYPYNTAIGLLISLFLVLLPSISPYWADLVSRNSITRFIFTELTMFGYFSTIIMLLLLAFTVLSSLYGGKLSDSWNIEKELSLPTARKIYEKSIYPKTIAGEICFYSIIGISFLSFFVWIYLPFGWVALLIKINI